MAWKGKGKRGGMKGKGKGKGKWREWESARWQYEYCGRSGSRPRGKSADKRDLRVPGDGQGQRQEIRKGTLQEYLNTFWTCSCGFQNYQFRTSCRKRQAKMKEEEQVDTGSGAVATAEEQPQEQVKKIEKTLSFLEKWKGMLGMEKLIEGLRVELQEAQLAV